MRDGALACGNVLPDKRCIVALDLIMRSGRRHGLRRGQSDSRRQLRCIGRWRRWRGLARWGLYLPPFVRSLRCGPYRKCLARRREKLDRDEPFVFARERKGPVRVEQGHNECGMKCQRRRKSRPGWRVAWPAIPRRTYHRLAVIAMLTLRPMPGTGRSTPVA